MNKLQLLVVSVMAVVLVVSTLQPVTGSDLETPTSRHKRTPGRGGRSLGGGSRSSTRTRPRGKGARGGRRGRRDASLDEEEDDDDEEALTSRHRRAPGGWSRSTSRRRDRGRTARRGRRDASEDDFLRLQEWQ